MAAHLQDSNTWHETAKVYKKITKGLATNAVTEVLSLANLLAPFNEATHILDNGSGPGPIMERLLKDYELPDNCELTCADFNQTMLDQVEETKSEHLNGSANGHWSRLQTVRQDAMNLDHFADQSLSHITAGWVYFMTADPSKCMSESYRTLKPGGVLSLSSWQSNQWMTVMGSMSKLHPDTPQPTIPEDWASVTAVTNQMEKAGFCDVISKPVEVRMEFERVDTLVDSLINNTPLKGERMKGLNETEIKQVRELMIETARSLCPQEPGALTGITIVATGRKKV